MISLELVTPVVAAGADRNHGLGGMEGDGVDWKSGGIERGDAPAGSHVVEAETVSQGMAVIDGASRPVEEVEVTCERQVPIAALEQARGPPNLGEDATPEFALPPHAKPRRSWSGAAAPRQYARLTRAGTASRPRPVARIGPPARPAWYYGRPPAARDRGRLTGVVMRFNVPRLVLVSILANVSCSGSGGHEPGGVGGSSAESRGVGPGRGGGTGGRRAEVQVAARAARPRVARGAPPGRAAGTSAQAEIRERGLTPARPTGTAGALSPTAPGRRPATLG